MLPVIGKDIAPIPFDPSPNIKLTSKGTKKSGVDIFLEERSRDERSKFVISFLKAKLMF
jgi:hypothetical protein